MSETLPPGIVATDDLEDEYTVHAPVAPDAAALQLEEYVQKAKSLEEEIGNDLQKVEEKKKRLRELLEKQLPRLMQRCRFESFKTQSGWVVRLVKDAFGRIPSTTQINKERDPEKRKALIEQRDRDIEYLVRHGQKHLIKHEFKVQFEIDQHSDAKKFARNLSKYKVQPHFTESLSVNPKSLSAVIKKMREQGKEIPADVLSVCEKDTVSINKR